MNLPVVIPTGSRGKMQILTNGSAVNSNITFTGVTVDPSYICVCRAPGSVYNSNRVLSAYGLATGTLTAACTDASLYVESTPYTASYTLTGGVLTLTAPATKTFQGGAYIAILFKN